MENPHMQVTASTLSRAIQADQAKPGLLGSTIGKVWNTKGVHKVPADPVTGFIQQGFSAAKSRLGYGEGRTLTERDTRIADIGQHLSKSEQNAIFDDIGPFLDDAGNRVMLAKIAEKDSAYRPLLVQLGAKEGDLDALAQAVGSESAPLGSLERAARARVTKALTLLTLSISALRSDSATSQPLDEGMQGVLTSEERQTETFTVTEEMMKDGAQMTAFLKKLSGNANVNQELANVLAESVRPLAHEFFFPSDEAVGSQRDAGIRKVMAGFAEMVNYSLYSDHRAALIKAGVAEEKANSQADEKYPELKESDNVVEYLLDRGLALPSIATRLAVLCTIHPKFDPAKAMAGKGRLSLPNKVFSEMKDAGLEPICDLCMPLPKPSYVTPMRDYFASAMHEYNTLGKHFSGVKALVGEKADVYAAHALLHGNLSREGFGIDALAGRYLDLCQEGSQKEQLQAVMSDKSSSQFDKQAALMAAIENRSDLAALNTALLVSGEKDAGQADSHTELCNDLHAALGMMSGVETRRALKSSDETFHAGTDSICIKIDGTDATDDIADDVQPGTSSVSKQAEDDLVISLNEENSQLKARLAAQARNSAQEKRQLQNMKTKIQRLQTQMQEQQKVQEKRLQQLISNQKSSAEGSLKSGKRGSQEMSVGKESETVDTKRQKRVTRSRVQP